MRLTKLGHSCVLVENNEISVLFDPGTWAERLLIDNVNKVDFIVYTHEHGDHFDIEILKYLFNKFPKVQVVCDQGVKLLIEQTGINIPISEQVDVITKFVSPHENLPLPNAQAPAENGYHYKDVFTHPGDSQHFYETKKVLAMPFIGPWGKTGDSIAKVIELKPEYVLPIHDWHYTNEAKEWLQGLLEVAFKDTDIKLLPNQNGKVLDI